MSMRIRAGLAAAAAAAGLALALAACSSGASGAGPATAPAGHRAAGGTASFGWFHAGPAPGTWHRASLPGQGTVLSYPASLHVMPADRGALTRGLPGRDGTILIYLNATPRQGDETIQDWPGFRLDHLREEGQRAVRLDATSALLGFRHGEGRCVIDSYTTGTQATYREIACYVRATHGASVLVAATPQRTWGMYAGVLERAVNSYVAG